MKTPDCVIWGLTKNNNAFLKKFNHNQWSHNPLSKTGFHNASSAASNCSVQGAKSVVVDKENKKEKTRQVFTIVTKHKMVHGKKAHKKNSNSGLLVNADRVTKGVHRAAKIIANLPYATKVDKKVMLRRLAKQSAAQRSHA